MKKVALLVIFCMSFASCTTTKSAVKTRLFGGTWELNYISGSRIAFDGLYPDKKPTIVFDMKRIRIAGNNSCNQYFGLLLVDGAKINFKDAKIVMTIRACQGNGDSVYMDTLNKIESYSITDDGKTLNFLTGNIVMMRFKYLK